jgi:hypothetical protein
MQCPHCTQPVFRLSQDGQKLKAKTSMLVLHKSGEVETNCGACGRGVIIPLTLKEGPIELKKSSEPRLIVRRS